MRRYLMGLGALLLLVSCVIPSTVTPQPQPTSTLAIQPTPTCTPLSATATVVTPTAAATVKTPVPVASTTPTRAPSATSQPCAIVAPAGAILYTRPFTEAAVFATLEASATIEAQARTEDGWYGFDPGVAQAANIGPFRLRWVFDDGSLQFMGGCEDLPVITGPPAGVCFTMPMEELEVHAAPAASSTVIAHLTVGDYAAVLARGETWALINLTVGNTGLEGQGWIPASALNLNGPCDRLPTPVP